MKNSITEIGDEFEKQYEKRKANGTVEGFCGEGTKLKNSIEIVEHLPIILETFKIKSVLDIPCGDMTWMGLINLDNIRYTGIDLIHDMIEDNKRKFIDHKNMMFVDVDIFEVINEIPMADLVICRDFFIHLKNSQITQLINGFRKSNCKYLLTTTFPKAHNNYSEKHLGFRKLNIFEEPFNLKNCKYVIQENDGPACQGRQLHLIDLEE